MSSRRAPLGLGLAALLSLLAAAACTSGSSAAAGRIPAVAGENFYGDLVTRIGGDRVGVSSIISDPAVDPHTYESSPANAEAVADASLVVENGLGYDAFVDSLLAASPRPDRRVVNVQQLLDLPDGSNPHVWYDPATMPKVARAVTDALDAIQPASTSTFEANLKTYLDSLAPIATQIASIRTRFPGAPIAYTESVPGYLVEALGFQNLTPAGFARAIENGTDPAPLDVAAEQDLITGHRVSLLLYNSQVTSPVTESVKRMAVTAGIPVVGVSETIPVSGQSYVDWQLAQLDSIDRALGGGQ